MALRLLYIRYGSVVNANVRPSTTKETRGVTDLQYDSLHQTTRLHLRTLKLLSRHDSLVNGIYDFTHCRPRLILNRRMNVNVVVRHFVVTIIRHVRRIVRHEEAFFWGNVRLRHEDILQFLRRISLVVRLIRLRTRQDLQDITMRLYRYNTH